MRKILNTAAAVAFGLMSTVASAADYPSKPVSFVVPWPPGDLEDILTRMIAEDFQATHGVAAAVVNKPGGGGGPFPGALEVLDADADGYTVGSFVPAITVVGPNLDMGIEKDSFEPVGIFLTYPFVIAAAGDAPYNTFEEMVEYGKSNDLALGHFGTFLPPTKVTMAATNKLGMQWGSEAAFDALDCNTLASGDADVINTTLQLILPCLDDVKVLVSITNERITAKVPNTPTMGEIVPELGTALWNGLFVKKGTPQAAKDALAASAEKTMQTQRARAIIAQTGAQVYWKGAAEAQAIIDADRANWPNVVKLLD